LTLFLDAIDNADLYKLFMHKYNVTLWCITCSKIISKQIDESCIMRVPIHLSGLISENSNRVPPLNSHILQYVSELDDYTCSDCKLKKCCRIYQLTNAPTIITVQFNKFYEKTDIKFPMLLHFPSSNTTLKYMIVSQIEHMGTRHGGHYRAQCFREGKSDSGEQSTKDMYELDDKNVRKGTYVSSKETYIVFYHIM
jgi:ubiquitin C-terminal hydrolase